MVMENDWSAVRQHLELDTTVTVRVKAIHKAHRFRFPLELECVQPAIGHLLRTPPPKDRPIIIYADEDVEEAAVRRLKRGRHVLACDASPSCAHFPLRWTPAGTYHRRRTMRPC
jgi:hypothetical protein